MADADTIITSTVAGLVSANGGDTNGALAACPLGDPAGLFASYIGSFDVTKTHSEFSTAPGDVDLTCSVLTDASTGALSADVLTDPKSLTTKLASFTKDDQPMLGGSHYRRSDAATSGGTTTSDVWLSGQLVIRLNVTASSGAAAGSLQRFTATVGTVIAAIEAIRPNSVALDTEAATPPSST